MVARVAALLVALCLLCAGAGAVAREWAPVQPFAGTAISAGDAAVSVHHGSGGLPDERGGDNSPSVQSLTDLPLALLHAHAHPCAPPLTMARPRPLAPATLALPYLDRPKRPPRAG
ncbi:MAG: hypothetical protein ABI574_05240 [Burkholderiales bacterium]